MVYKKSIGIIFERSIGDLIYTSSIVGSIRKNEPDAMIHVVTSDLGMKILKSEKPDYNLISTKFNNLVCYDSIYYPLRCAQHLPNWNKYKKHIRDLAAESINLNLSVTYSNIINPKDEEVSNECTKLKNKRYIIVNNRASSDRLKEIPINIMNEFLKKINKDLSIYQIGLSQDPPLTNADQTFLGDTNIIDSLYLIKNASMVIGIDNFVLHAASAYNIPWLGVYGFYDFKQVCPIDTNRNKYYKVINKGKFADYNMNGCSDVSVNELYESYTQLKNNINEEKEKL